MCSLLVKREYPAVSFNWFMEIDCNSFDSLEEFRFLGLYVWFDFFYKSKSIGYNLESKLFN